MAADSIAAAPLVSALAAVLAPAAAQAVARVGGIPIDGPTLVTIGMFGMVSMLTALGASMMFKSGMWGMGKTVFNGTVWGFVTAGASVMSEVSHARTLIYVAAVGFLAELLLSKAYRWARDSDAVTLWQLARSLAMTLFRIPQPPPPPTPPEN